MSSKDKKRPETGFDESMQQKYGNLNTIKSFLNVSTKAYDDNLDGLLKFLSEDNETLEKNMLTQMNDETVSEFVNKYGVNPEILVRLLTKLSESLVDPLVEGYYDRTDDFGEVTNSEHKLKKKKKKGKKKHKTAKSISQKKITKGKKKKPKNRPRAQTNALLIASSPLKKSSGKSPNSPKSSKTPKSPKSPKKNKKKSQKSPISPVISKSPNKKSTETPAQIMNLPEMELDETKEASETEEKEEYKSKPHALISSNTLEEYLNNYYLKFVHFDGNKKESLTYPLAWTCLYYHQMGADFEFDILEDVNDENEKIDLLWQEWIDKSLCVYKTEYDSDDNKVNGDDDEDALLTQVPDFIYDFYKDINNSYDIYNDNKGNKHNIYTYRIRRWISADLQEIESKTIPNKFKNAPKYSWVADKISYLDDYILTDDLIVIQDKHLLCKPTWFKWLDNNQQNGLDFIRNSGFFKNKNKSGVYTLLNDKTKVNILDNGICGIGDFKIGANPGDDLDLYGIIRLDVLIPSLLRFPLYKAPIINIGKGVLNDNNVILPCELKCKLPIIQNGGLCFDNIQRYENQRGNKDVAIRIDLKPLIMNYNNKGELNDIWTLYLCFAHPMCNKKDEKCTLLFKKHCIDVCIENTYDDDNKGKKLIKEELVLKIFSINSGSRFIEIFRKKIKSNKPTNVNILIISFNINTHKIFCSLNGRQLTLSIDEINRTNLLNLKKSSDILLGHKCTSSDTGTIQNLFNGYLFQFCIYPKCFHEFELRSFQQQCKVHIQKYCKMLQDY